MSSQLALPTLCKTITTLIAKGDAATEKAEQFYIAAGRHLAELKERKPDDRTWDEYVKEKCGIGKSRAYELIAIADGRTSIAEVRAEKAESVRRVRENRPLRSGHDLVSVATGNVVRLAEYIEDDEEEPDTPKASATRKRSAFLIFSNEAMRMAEYEGPVDREIADAARRTADAWDRLATQLENQS